MLNYQVHSLETTLCNREHKSHIRVQLSAVAPGYVSNQVSTDSNHDN